MMKLDQSHVKNLRKRYETMASRMEHYREVAKDTTHKVVHLLEAGGTAFSLGVADGYHGGVELVGVPLPLLVAGGSIFGGFVLDDKELSPHLHAIATGAVCTYAGNMGFQAGRDWKAKSLAKGNGGSTQAQQLANAVPAPANP